MIAKTKAILASSLTKGVTGVGLLEVIHQADFPNLAQIEGLVKIAFQLVVGITYLWAAWKTKKANEPKQ